MNNPLPYRAFLIKEKRMVEVQGIDWTLNGIEYSCVYDEENEYWSGSFWASFADIILMQSTGQPDINNKEIHEDDLLRSLRGTTVRVFYDKTSLGFKAKNKYGEIVDFAQWCAPEIIGNVHENPELMGEER